MIFNGNYGSHINHQFTVLYRSLKWIWFLIDIEVLHTFLFSLFFFPFIAFLVIHFISYVYCLCYATSISLLLLSLSLCRIFNFNGQFRCRKIHWATQKWKKQNKTKHLKNLVSTKIITYATHQFQRSKLLAKNN